MVGAGFTGLWTAYYLLRADPTLRVVVLEQETAGFGASGRNGGWCSALFPASLDKLAGLPGSDRDRALAQHAAMRDSVDEVGRVCAAEGIDAHFHKGGTVSLARSRAQPARPAPRSPTHARGDAGTTRSPCSTGRTPYAGWPRPGPSAAPSPPTAPRSTRRAS